MLLITDVKGLFCPESSELTGLLLAGDKVAALLTAAQTEQLRLIGLEVEHLSGQGLIATPGLVDMHVHVTGGGGEAGPSSRVPEGQLSHLLDAGITSVVGLLGTDSISRSQENLVAKCQALNMEGITCYHWCGGYRVPPATITGNLQTEMLAIWSCLGVGEIAVSDHRSSVPAAHEIARLASEVRIGGMLTGKCGLLYCHMGGGKEGLQPLRDALALTEIPITQILPTHMARSSALVQDGAQWLQDGGWLDFTAGDQALEALCDYAKRSLPLQHCTVSSDAFGSMPVFDASSGKLVSYDVGQPLGPLQLIQDFVLCKKWTMTSALQFSTANAAAVLRLANKGQRHCSCSTSLPRAKWCARQTGHKEAYLNVGIEYILSSHSCDL